MTSKEVIHTDVIHTELAQMNKLLTIYLIILGLPFRSLRIFQMRDNWYTVMYLCDFRLGKTFRYSCNMFFFLI